MNVGTLKRLLESLPDDYLVYIPRDSNWDYYNEVTTSMIGNMEHGEFVEDSNITEFEEYSGRKVTCNCIVLAD